MSGNASRSKGRRGHTAFAGLLAARDWTAAETAAGMSQEDFLAVDPVGKLWAVEVKNTAAIIPAHLKQAKDQARRRGKAVGWLLANHIQGTSSWLIQRQGERPVVWHAEQE